MNHEQMLRRVEQLEAKYGTAPGYPKTREQWRRFVTDTRLAKNCEACGHPGYAHTNAERQFEMGGYGVFVFEAGGTQCEDCEAEEINHSEYGWCGWYEGDNWKPRG